MLKAKDFCDRLKYLEAKRSTFYNNVFPANCCQIHEGGVMSADCINVIKSVINEPDIVYKYAPVGYFVQPGQVIPDTTELGLLNLCTDVSYDFRSIVPGEYLYMSGHGAIFVGAFEDPSGIVNVVECTPAFGGGVVTSYVDASGRRFDHQGGYQIARWEAHGKLSKYIEYDKPEPAPTYKLDVDGEWGYKTTIVAQQFFGTEQDGEVSNQDMDCRPFCLNCVPKGMPFGSWVWNNSNGYSPLIQKIQIWLGMERKDQDGKFGYETIKALQKRLKVKVDGYCGEETVKAFQHYLNTH